MRITVITTVRNAVDSIRSCLASVACQRRISASGQSFEIEHIVVDGVSTDGTAERIRAFQPPVRLISELDRGIFDGMNKGIRFATGEVVGFLNADDFYFHDNALAGVVQAMTDPRVDVCHGNVVYVKPNDVTKILRVWRGRPSNFGRLRNGWMPPHPTFFVRRECYRRYGGFREELGGAADYELMMRFLAKVRLRAVYVPGLWVAMRAGGNSNASIAARLTANRMDCRAWTVNDLRPSLWFRFLKPARKLPQYLPIGRRRYQSELAKFTAELDDHVSW